VTRSTARAETNPDGRPALAAVQLPPPSMVLKTPPPSVAAYSVVGDFYAADIVKNGIWNGAVGRLPKRDFDGADRAFPWRTRRYELALMREKRHVKRAIRDDEDILEALRAGNLHAACSSLKRSLESGKEPIVAWLKKRKPKSLRG
jgi:hypothetical protein